MKKVVVVTLYALCEYYRSICHLRILFVDCRRTLSSNLSLSVPDPTRSPHFLHPIFKGSASGSTAPSWHILVKKHVNLFERLLGRLGVGEKCMSGHDEAKRAEYHVGLPLDVGERWGDEEG